MYTKQRTDREMRVRFWLNAKIAKIAKGSKREEMGWVRRGGRGRGGRREEGDLGGAIRDEVAQ